MAFLYKNEHTLHIYMYIYKKNTVIQILFRLITIIITITMMMTFRYQRY